MPVVVVVAAALVAGTAAVAGRARTVAAAERCTPTPEDMLGPFYEPDAPVRTQVGTGYVLRGTVRSAVDCRPIPAARVELWLAGPRGYDDEHRATVIADENGEYRFESDLPVPYERRPPHIHVRVEHPGFETLVTQHYPAKGARDGVLELVLKPG
jgi:protocatechuate 3,4-dioxygenase beta subunit